MVTKIQVFDPKKLLSSEKIIESAGSHLYLIGLSRFPFGPKKRNRFNNPLFSLLLLSVFFIRCVLMISLSEEKAQKLALISGDYSEFFKVRKHFNLGLLGFISTAIVDQLIYSWIHYKNIKPNYLKPFEMMSGLISPQSIGLTEEEAVDRLLKRAKIIFKFFEINSYLIPLFDTAIPILTVYLTKSFFELIFYGIPSSLISYSTAYFLHGYQFWQLSYFYLICYYLKSKLRHVNKRLENMTESKGKKRFAIILVMKSLYSIYDEIKSYNDNFWSKHLLNFVLIWITAMNVIVYVSIFGIMDFYVRLLFLYVSFIFIITYLLIINSASSVPYEANKSYKLLNKLQILCHKKNIPVFYRIKV
jgi:hypothetical protein